MTVHQSAEHHKRAAEHHRVAAELHERAAKHHEAGENALAANCAFAAQGHSLHATYWMSEAAKIHAEQHEGNKHAHS